MNFLWSKLEWEKCFWISLMIQLSRNFVESWNESLFGTWIFSLFADWNAMLSSWATYPKQSTNHYGKSCSVPVRCPQVTRHGGVFPSSNFVNTLKPRQNGRHCADDTFKRIFVNENFRILIEISLKFVPKGPINNISALVQIMAWRRPGDKPLSEPMMVCLPTHICVTRPQWVNSA